MYIDNFWLPLGAFIIKKRTYSNQATIDDLSKLNPLPHHTLLPARAHPLRETWVVHLLSRRDCTFYVRDLLRADDTNSV